MKEVSILKDLIRNTPHAVVIRQDERIAVKALTEFGATVVKDVVSAGKINFTAVPDGFGMTDFRSINSKIDKIIENDLGGYEYIDTERISALAAPMRAKSLVERNVMGRMDRHRAPSGASLSDFRNADSKINIVDYKASKFKSTSGFGSVISTIKRNGIGFDVSRNLLVGRKSNEFAPVAIERVASFIGEGKLRRFMSAKTDYFDETFLNRRTARRLESLVPKTYSQKSSMEHRLARAVMSRLR